MKKRQSGEYSGSCLGDTNRGNTILKIFLRSNSAHDFHVKSLCGFSKILAGQASVLDMLTWQIWSNKQTQHESITNRLKMPLVGFKTKLCTRLKRSEEQIVFSPFYARKRNERIGSM